MYMYMYVCKGVLLAMVGINWDLFSFFLSSSFLPSSLSFHLWLACYSKCYAMKITYISTINGKKEEEEKKETNIILHLHVKKQTYNTYM